MGHDNGTSIWFLLGKVFLEIFREGAFSTAGLPLDVEEAGGFRSRPSLVLGVFPEPPQRIVMLFGNFVIPCIVMSEKAETFYIGG